MREVGRKVEYSESELKSVSIAKDFNGLASAFPRIPEGRKLLCIVDKWGASDGTEQMYICETIEDINQLLNRYSWALDVSFATVANEHFEIEEKMSREALVTLMKSSASGKEWAQNCQKVKALFNGQYPPFWFGAILVSGVLDEVQKNWPKQSATAVPERLSFVGTSQKASNNGDIESQDEDSPQSISPR